MRRAGELPGRRIVDRCCPSSTSSKSFGSTHALRGVSLDLRPGEIHALVGENGAGKSTLIKVMTGLYRPDAGHLAVDGEPVELRSPADAQALGIACIYQEPLVFPDLTVSENIFMGQTGGRPARALARACTHRAGEILAELEVDVDPRSRRRRSSRSPASRRSRSPRRCPATSAC